MKRNILFILVFFCIFFFENSLAIFSAMSLEDINKEIARLENQLSSTQNQAKNLSEQIKYFNNQINLTLLQIEESQSKINQLEVDIEKLSSKINRLEKSLDETAEILLNRIKATYISGQIKSLDLLFSSSGFSDFLFRFQYLKRAQAHDKKLMLDIQTTKVNYEEQKQLFEEKKKEKEDLKIFLSNSQIKLDSQKKDKENLLEVTKNDEKNYQNLLEKARQELAGFSAFTQSAGGGLINFGNGSNGWYYTQRDPQWGNMNLPGSSWSVLTAGCAVTSVAMVCKSYGQEITPASIIGNSSNFIGGDLWNWAFNCSGKTTDWIGNSHDQVKSYVQNNTPVILRLIVPSVSGLHFIVAFAWDDGKNDFKIHDPYYGPDKYFSEQYDWSQVTTGVVIH